MISSCKTLSHISKNKIDFERYADKKIFRHLKCLKILKAIDHNRLMTLQETHS